MRRHLTSQVTRFALLLAIALPAGCSQMQRTVREKYDDGSLKSEQEMESHWFGSTVKHGLYCCWHNNGQLMEEGLYRKGRMEGTWTTWDNQGRKRGEQRYQLGQRHGAWRSWHSNGRPARQWAYYRDMQDGLSVSWDQNGKETSRKRFRMGKVEP